MPRLALAFLAALVLCAVLALGAAADPWPPWEVMGGLPAPGSTIPGPVP